MNHMMDEALDGYMNTINCQLCNIEWNAKGIRKYIQFCLQGEGNFVQWHMTKKCNLSSMINNGHDNEYKVVQQLVLDSHNNWSTIPIKALPADAPSGMKLQEISGWQLLTCHGFRSVSPHFMVSNGKSKFYFKFKQKTRDRHTLHSKSDTEDNFEFGDRFSVQRCQMHFLGIYFRTSVGKQYTLLRWQFSDWKAFVILNFVLSHYKPMHKTDLTVVLSLLDCRAI